MSRDLEQRRRDDVVRGIAAVGAAVAVMWVVEVADQVALNLDQHGIRPRDPDGLAGILAAPFLHGGFGHLLSNTIPLIVLGAMVALSGLARVLAVGAVVALVGGLGTWLTGPAGTVHIGASGLVFGFAAYLIARALYSRALAHLAGAVLVVAVWGFTLLGGLVPTPGISWQGHLFGAIGGLIAARMLHRRDPAPSQRSAYA
jgi:membrane associated rhomboid family serine protease